jgi:hypothetical protein
MNKHFKAGHKENKAICEIGKWKKPLSNIISTTKRLFGWYLK